MCYTRPLIPDKVSLIRRVYEGNWSTALLPDASLRPAQRYCQPEDSSSSAFHSTGSVGRVLLEPSYLSAAVPSHRRALHYHKFPDSTASCTEKVHSPPVYKTVVSYQILPSGNSDLHSLSAQNSPCPAPVPAASHTPVSVHPCNG